MNFEFNKAVCQNLRESVALEWLETNGVGGYASSSIVGCNTRKYHGLYVAALDQPAGRYVLLSTMEESLIAGGSEFFFSCRRHPGCFYPKGHEYLREARIGAWPLFRYRIGDVVLTKEVMMPQGRHALMLRYSVECANEDVPAMTLKLKPLLAYRSFHELTHANTDLQVRTFPVDNGFKVQPYNSMPPMFMQAETQFQFYPSPEWYYNVEYPLEQERGFPYREDLFQPGIWELTISPEHPVLISVSLVPFHGGEAEALWQSEVKRRTEEEAQAKTITGHLAREGRKFLVTSPSGRKTVIAGYPWFGTWGRDTMISLPGLTFFAGRPEMGVEALSTAADLIKDGLIPNVYGADGKHSYNSADASLWYIWAVQQMMTSVPDGRSLVKKHCWNAVKEIISAYSEGRATGTTMDSEGMLHVGTPDTQLTWMDAQVNGKPVTPRWGCPVEINALWYNALAFALRAASAFDETPIWNRKRLNAFKATFLKRFWSEERGYLADVWRPEGSDWSFRPNQLFAASMPEPVLDRAYAIEMVNKVRTRLLTPFGVRTLDPNDKNYHFHYEGGPAQRDEAYHQGTVWPWLLGPYFDALFFSTWDHDAAARHFLRAITPLFTVHLKAYGVGSICEVFDAVPSYHPNGCIAQAWSVAEVLRALRKIQKHSPAIYRHWEEKVREEAK